MDGDRTAVGQAQVKQEPTLEELAKRQRSAPPGKTSEELVKYVFVELEVARGNHLEFQKRMPDLVELMFAHKRWELVFASYPITGPVNRFVHIWKIPDESTLVEVMRDGAVDLSEAALPAEGTLEATFRNCYLDVQALIQNTDHRLLTALPYDPTHVGFQSQTILIDVDGEAFILDHAKLRSAAEKQGSSVTDIGDDLEQVRRARFVRRNRANEPLPKDDDAETQVSKLEARDKRYVQWLEDIQKHLNRGSVTARLTLGKEQVLLCNLASLKAKSVYQAVERDDPEPAEAGKAEKEPRKPPKVSAFGITENNQADVPVDRLLIAMPWGGVYDMKAGSFQTMFETIPQGRAKATHEALTPIRAALTPIAAIPEERDDIIGDGCACFVINLQSFSAAASGLAQKARKELDDKKKGS